MFHSLSDTSFTLGNEVWIVQSFPLYFRSTKIWQKRGVQLGSEKGAGGEKGATLPKAAQALFEERSRSIWGEIMSRRRERDEREMTGANTTPLAWVKIYGYTLICRYFGETNISSTIDGWHCCIFSNDRREKPKEKPAGGMSLLNPSYLALGKADRSRLTQFQQLRMILKLDKWWN